MKAQTDLLSFIDDKSFPCIMAKAVMKQGFLNIKVVEEIDSAHSCEEVLTELYQFISKIRAENPKLSSFALVIQNEKYREFEVFEKSFWPFLSALAKADHAQYPHDPRVGDDPKENDYSYSLMSEAFFILALHPQSERLARKFAYPAIIFNPHIQFEKMRQGGIFKKVRDTIRMRDLKLQGTENVMLKDFGERSEVYQYLGKAYAGDEEIPLAS